MHKIEWTTRLPIRGCVALAIVVALWGVGFTSLPIAPLGAAASPHSGPTSAIGVGASAMAAARTSLLATSPSGHPAASGPRWSTVSAPTPTARTAPSLAWDGVDKYYLLFGGYGTSTLSDTWKFSPTKVWTPLHPSASPSARYFATMAYDGATKSVILYGGYSSFSVTLSDTWSYAAGKWTKLSPATNPGGLAEASMTYDTAAGVLLLFGGNTGSGYSAATWSYNGVTWTKLAPSSSPSLREDAMLGYDPVHKVPLLFGGYNASGLLRDTWNYSGGTWHHLAPVASPPARETGGLVYDLPTGGLLLFGGVGNGGYLGDTWSWSGTNWTKLSGYTHPGARYQLAAADGNGTVGSLWFAGTSPGKGYVGDTWIHAATGWTAWHSPLPVGRNDAMMAWDASDNYVVLFGGANQTSFTFLSDTWKFVGGVWSPIVSKVHPSARVGGSMVYDSTDGYVLLFGGGGVAGDLSDTWSFHGGQWTQLIASGQSGPTGRYLAMAADDPADGYVVMFGGYNASSGGLGDTWTYSYGTWTVPAVTASPVARWAGQMSYDSNGGQVVLTGGSQASTYLIYPDTWVFTGGNWKNVTASLTGAPPAVYEGNLVDDSYDGYVVMTDGYDQTNLTTLSNTYNVSTAVYTWGIIPTSLAALPVILSAAAYDPIDKEIVDFSGYVPSTSTSPQTTWVLTV